ncbi:MAG TPA: nucleoside diphosphate kinase regulator [Azospirillaceae bacterium]|nr:nucleoside diphosphate kinase regulator [Azospirillaceae bacterium]HRQ79848.1 nucleoside diphosphate kinase regulator [Azospirillaceae bacterium]
MTALPITGDLPPITLTRSVYQRLADLSEAAAARSPEVAEYLDRELDRARLVDDGALSTSTVSIGSRVQFVDLDANQRHDVVLVWPGEEDSARHRLSVMTPVGAALIGLRAGQGITWRNRAGVWRRLRVEKVGAL